MSDNYEFLKSTTPQGVDIETPYVSKQWAYLNDINNGVYSNGGLTLVQFDMSSIYNSTSLIDMSQAYLTIPLVITSAYTSSNSAGTVIAPNSQSAWCTHGLKCGYYQTLHAADLIVNGKTVNQYQPYTNVYTHFKLLSQMSNDDLRTIGTSIGFGEALDNIESLKYNGSGNQTAGGAVVYPAATSVTAGLTNGNGMCNNNPFSLGGSYAYVANATISGGIAASVTQTVTAFSGTISVGDFVSGPGIASGTTVANWNGSTTVTLSTAASAISGIQELYFYTFTPSIDGNEQGIQFTGSSNNGLYSRIKKYSDYTNGTYQNLYGAGGSTVNIMSQTQIANEFKPYTSINNTNYVATYDVAIIRLCDIFDSMKNLCLMKKFDGVLRLYFNTGVVSSVIQQNGIMITSASTNTFTNTCPIIQCAQNQWPYNAIGLTTSLSIAKAQTTNQFGGVNLATNSTGHTMTSCRLYYPQVTLKPERLNNYISANRNKKIVYTDYLFNQFNSITSAQTFSALVQSGVTNIRGLLLIPVFSSTTNGTVAAGVCSSGVTTFSQLQSPFDTCPATTGPYSLTNLQVSVAGVNILQNTLNYSFENFIEQVSLYEKINAGDLGLSCGLFNEFFWNNGYRAYYVDCSRANIADLMTPRNITISFLNNTNVTLDLYVFTEYFTEMVVDVETGNVSK